jgi:hypothetical protein
MRLVYPQHDPLNEPTTNTQYGNADNTGPGLNPAKRAGDYQRIILQHRYASETQSAPGAFG